VEESGGWCGGNLALKVSTAVAKFCDRLLSHGQEEAGEGGSQG
jgi:hypothetical protein